MGAALLEFFRFVAVMLKSKKCVQLFEAVRTFLKNSNLAATFQQQNEKILCPASQTKTIINRIQEVSDMNEKRKEILNMLSSGKINSEEAEKMLQSAAPTAAEQAGKIAHSISNGMKKGAHTLAQAVAQHTETDEKSHKVKQPDVLILPQVDWAEGELLPTVKAHAKNAALTAAASGLLPGAGPTVAAMTSAGFVLSMLHKINQTLGVKLSKDEMKPVADAIVHTVTPMAMAKFFAASGLSFIPVVGNVAAGAIIASVCHSITYASGVVYMETLRKLSAAGHDMISPDLLKETANSVIQSQDMAQVFEEAKRSYDADEK